MGSQLKQRTTKRDEYHHGDLRRVLIESAVQILRDEGFERLSLRHCAKMAQVSPSAPAHHFKSLNDLLTAVAAFGFEALAAHLELALARRKNGRSGPTRVLASAYLEFAVANDALYRVMFTPTLNLQNSDFEGAQVRCFMLLKNAVAEEGALKSECDVRAFRIWAKAHGFVVLLLGARLHLVFSHENVPKNAKMVSSAFLDYLFFKQI